MNTTIDNILATTSATMKGYLRAKLRYVPISSLNDFGTRIDEKIPNDKNHAYRAGQAFSYLTDMTLLTIGIYKIV